MSLELDLENIFRQAVREAVVEHLEQHPLTIPADATASTSTAPTATPAGPRYYTRQQAAQVANISLPTLHGLHNEGLVAFVKVGRATRIPADKFDSDLAAGVFGRGRKQRRAGR